MSEVQTVDFNTLEIGKLRQYAAHLRIVLDKKATKAEILKAIDAKLNGRAVPQLAESGSSVPPGYAKIKVLEDATPGASNIPVYINANGYEATLPRGVEIIVPLRVVGHLNNAVVRRRKQSIQADQSGREMFAETTIMAPSYPFQVIEMTPGPKVLTAHEKNKLKQAAPRKAYKQMFGTWPRGNQLRTAIAQGLIKLGTEDVIDERAADMVEDEAILA